MPSINSLSFRCPALLLAMMLLLASATANGQSREDEDGEYLLSEPTYNALNKINEQLQDGNYNGALTALRKLEQAIAADDDYEQAVVNQTFGYAYNGLERYDQAAEAFIQAVESNALPADVSHRLTYFIAQLLAQTGDYNRAISYLEDWLAAEDDPGVDAHRLAAGLYYELKNYAGVIEQAQMAIRKSKKANENLYQLLLAAYFETNDYGRAANLLERMLELFPDNPDYWKQLAASYQFLDQDRKVLAVTELANRRGYLNSQEKLNLARLYLSQQAPYRAARFLEQEMANGRIEKNAKNLKLLADSFHLARETDAAIEAYGNAARAAGNPELYFRQGQLLVQEQRWQEARDALQQALQNNDLDHRAMAHLLLGMSAYHLEDYERASNALKRAREYDKTRSQADYWLRQIEERSERD
ncbi:tetratricopeptide repeat protein [Methylohalomonas lacus]|nr:tetratricopeptide repeat protein [Methylohalomonas lacus]